MFRKWLILIVGYWCLYVVLNEVPTHSIQAFQRWLTQLIFEPFVFVSTSILFLGGVIAYAVSGLTILADTKAQEKRSLLQRLTFGAAFLISLFILYLLGRAILLISLPCSLIYGIISIAQKKKVERRQVGAE